MTAKKERKGKWINGPQHEQWKTLKKIMQKIITDREPIDRIINALSKSCERIIEGHKYLPKHEKPNKGDYQGPLDQSIIAQGQQY